MQYLEWKVGNPEIASLEANGNTATVKGLKAGKTEVMCSIGDKQVGAIMLMQNSTIAV